MTLLRLGENEKRYHDSQAERCSGVRVGDTGVNEHWNGLVVFDKYLTEKHSCNFASFYIAIRDEKSVWAFTR